MTKDKAAYGGWRRGPTATNKMFLQWCRDELHLSFIFIQRFSTWTGRGFGNAPLQKHKRCSPCLGTVHLCFKKTDGQFPNKDFPRGQVNGFADNLDFEKIKTWDRLKRNTADPSHFKEDCASTRPSHLPHAIAAQTHHDTKALARAKFPFTYLINGVRHTSEGEC